MHLSKYFLPVLKEPPKEAEIVSHQLMLRAGMIRQASAGIYSWLPLGLRVLDKWAVRLGGGQNHRMHLADGFLLKDNHRTSGLDLPTLVERARRVRDDVDIVVGVDDLEQLRAFIGRINQLREEYAG